MKISDVKTLIQSVLEYNINCYSTGIGHREYIVPFLSGNPGIGKTAAPRQVAHNLDIPHRTTIVAQYDPGELAGFPMPDHEKKRMIRFRPDFLPDGDPDENGNEQNPVCLWQLDELPQAPVAVMNLCAQIIEEWRIGEHAIHPGTTIICSGNPASNRAGTNTIPTHLRDRLMWIDVEADYDEFLNYASTQQLHPSVTSYIKRNPDNLAKFDPAERACPSPRSWFKVAALLGMNLPPNIRLLAITGYVGAAHAQQFESWLRVADRMPDPAEVIKNPDKAPVAFGKNGQDGTDVLIMLLCNIAALCNKKNIGNIIRYANRLPNQEFAVFCIQDCLRRNPDLTDSKEFGAWAVTRGKGIFD